MKDSVHKDAFVVPLVSTWSKQFKSQHILSEHHLVRL